MTLRIITEKLREKKYLYPILLGLFSILILLNNINWLHLDKSIPRGDHAGHIGYSYQYYHALQKGNIKFFVLNEHKNYPPAAYLITSLYRYVAGDGDDSAELSLSPFWFILIFSVYFLGKRLWNEDVGFISAVASFSFPFIITLSQSYLLDLPCAAMIALCLVCLFYSDAFEKTGWTIAFFIVLSLSLQIKWSSLFLVAVPAFIYFVIFLWQTFREKRTFPMTVTALVVLSLVTILGLIYNFHNVHSYIQKGGNLTLLYLIQMLIFLLLFVITGFLPFRCKTGKRFLQGLLLFIMIIWNFYGINIKILTDFMEFQQRIAVFVGDTVTPEKMFSLYFTSFQGTIRVVLLFAGLLWFIFDKEKNREKYIFFISFAGGVLILFLLPVKDLRYLAYLIPFVAIITTYWIPMIKYKFVRYPLIFLFLILSVMGTVGWRIPGHDKITLLGRIFLHDRTITAKAPDSRDWKNDTVAEKMYLYSKDESTIFCIIMIGEYAEKIASDFMIPFYGKYDSGHFIFINSIRGKEAQENASQSGRFFRFVLSPRRGFDDDQIYKKLLILYFRNKTGEQEQASSPSEDIQLKEVLEERGFTGRMNLQETVDLPLNSELNYLEMRLEPEIPLREMVGR